ncbi:MAG: SCP2 sterol-binding domain-containing protein [Deltaproteobacteria bacterium]|nr:SCP2 sterol-binding domain-containing protein [Deltaproteobacteria bacterium]
MASVHEIFTQRLPEKLKNKPEVVQGVNAVVEFQLAGDGGGTWTLDCTQPGGAIQSGSQGNAKVTVLMAVADFLEMMDGKLNAQKAFLTGKLKVKGDMGVALKLGQILG